MKKIFLTLIIFFLALQIVSATDTIINVKTIPYHTVQLTTFDPSSISFITFERFEGISDKYGDISFTFSSNEVSFKAIAFIKKYGEKVADKKFSQAFPTGQDTYLEIIPAGYTKVETPIINESANSQKTPIEFVENTTETTSNETIEETIIEEEPVEETKITKTGFVLLGEGGILSIKKIAYLSIIIFLLLTMSFFGVRKLKKISENKAPKEIVIKKLSEVEKEKDEEKAKTNQERLEEAERKIIEAQEEIKRIKSQSNAKAEKIKKAKEKLIEDQKELMRLRNEED